MLPKKPYDSPSTAYDPPATSPSVPPADFTYGFTSRSAPPPPASYYLEDIPQHFYRWSSPPGLVRGLEAAVLLLCVAIFACVASTCYGYGGYYGGVTNPRAANGFMIAAAVLCFLAQLGLLVASLSKASGSRSRRFYLVVMVVSGVLALLLLVASIVYVVGVNPQAQMSGGYYYSPLLAVCNQGTEKSQFPLDPAGSQKFPTPRQAVAIVCGFLIVLLLCLICLFAHKTRSKIWKYGKPNIYWDKIPGGPEGPDVEEWV
ncbi:OCLN protein, partial [Sylvia borin]|nr:OCLN protein [Sylvia borin]